ncbi:MAG: 3-dehydroquinate dehydratase [Acidimicrobiales bacterium]|nr:MAG: 3-dehydroquinate dehydratase [Acidimicrobiales bacterium]
MATRPVILLLSGPNLAILGDRQPDVYGTATLEEHVSLARRTAQELGYDLRHVHSDHEGDLVEAVHRARGEAVAVIVNPGALTHYGWSLHDALAAFDGPVVELHLTNPASREAWRQVSVIAPVASGVVSGFGVAGYRLAVEAVHSIIS